MPSQVRIPKARTLNAMTGCSKSARGTKYACTNHVRGNFACCLFISDLNKNIHQTVRRFVGPDLGPNCLQSLSAKRDKSYQNC